MGAQETSATVWLMPDAPAPAAAPAPTAEVVADVVNDLKLVLDTLQQQFDALKVEIQTRIDAAMKKLAGQGATDPSS